MIEAIAKLLKVLNSETEPGQISLALCLSMVAGLTPTLSLHNVPVLLLLLVLRANVAAFILGWLFFTGIAYLLDPLFHQIGLAILTTASLTDLWTGLYNIAWFRLDRLNNTIVMGSLIFSLVLFIPCLLVFNLLIRRYRKHLLAWMRKTRIVQAVKATKFYAVYQSLASLKGGVA